MSWSLSILSDFKDAAFLKSAAVALSIAAVCLLVQRFFKPYLERDQYYYLKDISLIGALALCGIWSDSPMVRVTLAAAVLSGLLGFCQKCQKNQKGIIASLDLRPFFWLIGFWLALFGPRITFIGLPYGKFFYLPELPSIFATAVWIGLFPILFEEIDQVPGLGGLLLALGWFSVMCVTLLSSPEWNDAVHISLLGLLFLGSFWTRHVHDYRRLGEPLSAMWGTLLAGTTILGVTKGLTFTTLLMLPLGIYALPLAEASLNLVSTAFTAKRTPHLIVYRMLVNHGLDHPAAIRLIALFCASLGLLVALSELNYFSYLPAIAAVFVIGALILIAYLPKSARPSKPNLWGVTLDNMSLNFALSKTRSWVSSGHSGMIVTMDALGALSARRDEAYRGAVKKADMVLPDGKGLIWALKFLGMPIQERLPGVEFVEHLCRQAAVEGWKVFFLGGKPGVAQAAADKLIAKYSGLNVAGFNDGYFNQDEESAIIDRINALGVQILFVGLGIPRQELWIASNLPNLKISAAMGMGGSMDVISGRLKRAPASWQKLGMEWLYRLIQEPWRYKKILNLPIFVIAVLRTGLLKNNK